MKVFIWGNLLARCGILKLYRWAEKNARSRGSKVKDVTDEEIVAFLDGLAWSTIGLSIIAEASGWSLLK